MLFPLALDPAHPTTLFDAPGSSSSNANLRPADLLSQVPRFPRNRLKLLEKLGEGRFGMVSQVIVVDIIAAAVVFLVVSLLLTLPLPVQLHYLTYSQTYYSIHEM